jgi:cbb3-type cytochrome oxidase subunit 1
LRISFSELRYVSSNAIIFGSTANNIGGSTYTNVYRMLRTRRMTQRRKRYWQSFSVKRIGASGAKLTMSWGSHVVDRYEGFLPKTGMRRVPYPNI